MDKKLSSISDPDLRQRQKQSDWATVNKADFVEDGRKRFLDARTACLTTHRADWFEVGHVRYGGTNELVVSSIDASPLSLAGDISIPFSIGEMDRVYSKFHTIVAQDVESQSAALIARRSCKGQLQTVCKNLGGSDGECSDSSRLADLQEQLGVGCAVSPNMEDARTSAENELRKQRLVLVGQGDLIEHRIDKLMLVDYDSETILSEVPKESINQGDLSWRLGAIHELSGARPPSEVAEPLQPIPEELETSLESWSKDINSNNADAISSHYAEHVQRYFLAHDLTRNDIRKSIAGWLSQGNRTVTFTITKRHVTMPTVDEAAVEMVKSSVTQTNAGLRDQSTKSVVRLKRITTGWEIVSDRDLK